MIKIFLISLLVVVLSLFIYYNKNRLKFDISSGKYRYIAHAGGGIDGKTYTNSAEALSDAVKNGYKFIEIDMLVSSDGKIVAAHDWRQFHRRTGFEGAAKAITKDEFLSHKIDGKFTPIDGEYINKFFAENPDLYLVTDKIKDYKLLLQEFKHHDRLLVEVFSVDDYNLAKSMGIKYPALCIWKADDLGIVDDNSINMITTPIQQVIDNKEKYAKYYKAGVKILAFSTNSVKTAENSSLPVNLYYTDRLKEKK